MAAGELPILSTKLQDIERAAEILDKYTNSKIDYVDAVIMAIAERLDIERILTVDRRDFSIFRPKHCDVFEIVP
ncbi:MAG: PIN domain-containing protein [Acidobacteria bacterium]|nr:PIN domain-containing protein [Acidobacteriota bacterium]